MLSVLCLSKNHYVCVRYQENTIHGFLVFKSPSLLSHCQVMQVQAPAGSEIPCLHPGPHLTLPTTSLLAFEMPFLPGEQYSSEERTQWLILQCFQSLQFIVLKITRRFRAAQYPCQGGRISLPQQLLCRRLGPSVVKSDSSQWFSQKSSKSTSVMGVDEKARWVKQFSCFATKQQICFQCCLSPVCIDQQGLVLKHCSSCSCVHIFILTKHLQNHFKLQQ